MRRLKTQSGVAMVTVLFIGAVLTVVTSTAAFITVQEFRGNTGDRRGALAFGYAEAGLERTLLHLRGGDWDFLELVTSGCNGTPLLSLGGEVNDQGRFETVIVPDQCPAPGVTPSPKVEHSLAIESTGCIPLAGEETCAAVGGQRPTARRVLRQGFLINGLNLPLGLYAGRVDANGRAEMTSISVLSPGVITGREKLSFGGDDPYWLKSDFWPCSATVTPPDCYPAGGASDGPLPASAHAGEAIYFIGGGGAETEHTVDAPLNCDANGTAGGASRSQSVWDSSGTGGDITTQNCSPATTVPPTSLFDPGDAERLAPTPELNAEDEALLKNNAKSSGLYCSHTDGVRSCTVQGSPTSIPGTFGGPGSSDPLGPLGDSYVVYIEFDPGTDPFSTANTVKWDEEIPNCEAGGSVIIIIKNGSLSLQSGSRLTGAIFAEDGRVDSEGQFTVEGTLIAKEVWVRGGATYELTECFVSHTPGPFLRISPTRWSEVDGSAGP